MSELAVSIEAWRDVDVPLIERLDARVFGPGRFARSAYRLREGGAPEFGLSRLARIGSMMVGANRMTLIRCGDRPALLLGPLTVEPAFRKHGIGGRLIASSLEAARAAGHCFVLLVGDLPYYGRHGFSMVKPGQITMPGPVDPARLLVCELEPGSFVAASGLVLAA
ncbi:MAG: N-acetyltransferase [Hyphomicrobiales bacterium]|nr:N-acetyltransferase [Hyphomicrobiales bacterium]